MEEAGLDRRTLLNALKLELQFCERGGYRTITETPHASSLHAGSAVSHIETQEQFRKERSLFQDSPWCLNYRLPIREHPCSACWLMHFVPPERQRESVPCHHIPLNERGDTAASLAGPAGAPEVQQAVLDWLRAKIAELEASLG
ncbi:MAG TPA: hypothetical protein VMD78_15425 [Candidatus Baltobacteraceae bacterium]|nr:hypothetical protein [Candidatus Baltobacteraceae bacterium]